MFASPNQRSNQTHDSQYTPVYFKPFNLTWIRNANEANIISNNICHHIIHVIYAKYLGGNEIIKPKYPRFRSSYGSDWFFCLYIRNFTLLVYESTPTLPMQKENCLSQLFCRACIYLTHFMVKNKNRTVTKMYLFTESFENVAIFTF